MSGCNTTSPTTFSTCFALLLVDCLERHLIECLDDVQLPRRKAHAVQLLEREDVLGQDRPWAVRAHAAADSPKYVPQRAAGTRPLDVQPRIVLAGVLGGALQVRAQRSAVTLARRQLILGARAFRQAFAEAAIKSSVFWMPARTWPRSHCFVGSVSSARTFAGVNSSGWPPFVMFQLRHEATR